MPLRAASSASRMPTRAKPPSAEIEAMAQTLAEGLELGALGFSTDQVIGNPGPDGTALPGQVCGEEELLAFARVLGQGPGPGLFTMANAALLQGRPEREADLVWHRRLAHGFGPAGGRGPDLRIPRGSGWCRCHHGPHRGRGSRTGSTVIPQISTRPFELWTRVDSPGLLVRCLPTLMEAVRAGGADGVRALAADPTRREQLRHEGRSMPSTSVFSGRWEHVGVRYSHQPGVVGRSVAVLAAERGRTQWM